MTLENPGLDNTKQPTKRWKKVFLIFSASVFAFLIVISLAAFFLEDKLKAMIVAEINEQVSVPVKVDGGISLSLLKHFPYASVSFADVSIDDRLRKGNAKLLNVKEVSFLCNIYSLFGNEIEFSRIIVRQGELNMYKNEAGKTNYEILKPSLKDERDKISLQLKRLQIKDVKFTYADKIQASNMDMKLKDVVLKGNFNEKNFTLALLGKIKVNKIISNGDELLADKSISADIIMDVDKAKQKYNFEKGTIAIEETEFSITGFLVALKNETKVSFKLLTAGKDIQQLFSLFPQKYKDAFAGADGSGEYSIDAGVNGTFGKNSLPNVNVNLSLKESELKFGTYNKMLKNVNASARYELDEKGHDKIIISNFNCTLNSQPFNFRLSLSNLANPDFDFYVNGVLYLSEIAAFIPDSLMQDIEGSVTFSNFHLKGNKRDFYQVDNSTLTGSGTFKLSEVEFRQNGITYGNINGLLKYENEIIEASNLTLNFLSTDFNFSGGIDHLFPFVYNLSAKRKANEVVLGINGKIKMQTFNLTAILDAYDKKSRPKAQKKEKLNIREVFSMRGNIDVEIEKFLFRKMQFDGLKTNVQVAPGYVQINSLTTTTMGGDLRSAGLVSFTNNNALNLKLDITAVELDIPKIFAECEDFGQTVLTGKNLKGTITTSVTFDATWNNYKELDAKSLSAIIDFRIKNGQLVKFAPLRAASKFIRIEELEDIRFADLENTIKVANSRFDIPEFEIKTSALNLMFFGNHSFDNTVDYHLKINLHKMLASKWNRRGQQDMQYIENDPYEGVNVYLAITGNLSDPKIKFDKSSTRNKVLADFRKEKTVLKDLLKNTPKKMDEAEQKREDKYFQVKEEPQFMDFDTTAE